jgi:putative Ca2+/H+ antiporter (TMEM165/GDT1 family)
MNKPGFLIGAVLSLVWMFGLTVLGTWYWNKLPIVIVSFASAAVFAFMAALGFLRLGMENHD